MTEKATYSYDLTKDNALSETTFTDNSKSGIEYDALGRVSSEKLVSSDGFFANVAFYTYTNRASNPIYTSGLVSRISYSRINDTLSYTYDKLGNITSVTHADGTKETYTYDALSRLVRVDSQVNNETVVYTYNNSGNILNKKTYAYTTAATPSGTNTTVAYTYDTTWKDKLASYNGTAITYDALGNPLTYGSNTYTWNGRRMATYSNGTKTASYKYDENGVRTSKTVNGTKTSFFVDGTTILAQKAGNIKIPFYYDGNGKRIAFKYGGSMYFYVYNLQGDVTHILDDDANIVGTYTYDAWGKITNLSSLTSIAQTNPFRYRGYYYDTESGLYYLNSRYYNPDWGRFLNADDVALLGVNGDFTSYNIFAYCGNNPVMYCDPNGTFSMSALMTTLHAITYVASEAVETARNDAESKAFVENAKTAVQSIYTSLVDDTLSPVIASMVPKSALSGANALRSLGYISESMGVVSAATAIFQIAWDYETYKNDLGLLAKAGGITVLSTAVSVGWSSIILASGVTFGPALAMALVGGLAISFGESKLREWLLE